MDYEKENVTAILEKNTYVDHKCIYSGNLKYCISTTKKSENSIKTAAPYRNALENCHASFKQLGTSGKSHMNITSSKILKQQHERLRISLKMVIQRNQIVSKYPL